MWASLAFQAPSLLHVYAAFLCLLLAPWPVSRQDRTPFLADGSVGRVTPHEDSCRRAQSGPQGSNRGERNNANLESSTGTAATTRPTSRSRRCSFGPSSWPQEPIKPKRRGLKPQPASMSMFEWPLEQEQEAQPTGVGS